jgi:hypothetical protein
VDRDILVRGSVRIPRILSKGECQELANSNVAESSQGFIIVA